MSLERELALLLVSPADTGLHEGNFGCAHLVALGSYLEARTDASVTIVDLACEPWLNDPAPERVFSREFAVVGLSCYSSFDYLQVFYLAQEMRRRHPEVLLVVGGYHASARPEDFLNLAGSHLREPSPFDHVVVGEGELPLSRIVSAAARGERMPEPVLGPEPVPELDDLPPMNWHLMDRYRPVLTRTPLHVATYLSRGCPYHCSFCMERCKGEQTWRAFSPWRAERELRGLASWLGQHRCRLFLADAVFGLQREWRREMLGRMQGMADVFTTIWALTRVDLIDDGDLARYAGAGFSLGLGLESGDPGMLRIMRKTADAGDFATRCRALATEAAMLNLPWGANIILGHPGETEESMRTSAAAMTRLFLETNGLTGFLSVDPYRFYPGSEVDHNWPHYATTYGAVVQRPRWWDYSEQAFCAEWVDPSWELDYRRREALSAKLFGPLVQGIADAYALQTKSRDYYMGSVRRARDCFGPAARLHRLSDYHLWSGLTGRATSGLREDPAARPLFRDARARTLAAIESDRDLSLSTGLREALIEIPRERYVPDAWLLKAAEDCSLPLLADGSATISAPHAYARAYSLLELTEGDRLLDMGGGTGYGAALAARVVGPQGSVTTVEIHAGLAAQARERLRDERQVEVLEGDADAVGDLPCFSKVVFGYALSEAPVSLLARLPDGGRLVAPVRQSDGTQRLMLYCRHGEKVMSTEHGAVLYVADATSRSAT